MPLPVHDLDHGPCLRIVAEKQGYCYCKLYHEIKNIHLESIENHIKFKDPDKHKAELIKFCSACSWLDDSINR